MAQEIFISLAKHFLELHGSVGFSHLTILPSLLQKGQTCIMQLHLSQMSQGPSPLCLTSLSLNISLECVIPLDLCSLGDQDYHIGLLLCVVNINITLDINQIKHKLHTFFSCGKCLVDFWLNMMDTWIYLCSLLNFFYDGGNWNKDK